MRTSGGTLLHFSEVLEDVLGVRTAGTGDDRGSPNAVLGDVFRSYCRVGTFPRTSGTTSDAGEP